jgi:hypothetical protein
MLSASRRLPGSVGQGRDATNLEFHIRLRFVFRKLRLSCGASSRSGKQIFLRIKNAFTLEESYMPILIAEDDAASATFVRKGLEAEHYAVDVSQYGEQTRAHGV